MLKDMSRSRVIQVWFAAIALIVATGAAFGVSVTLGTGALLLALCLVPPAILLMLWPRVPPPTVAELLHDADRRS